jgi:hypothetical protein
VEWTPPASQADLDRIIGERLARERAKFADYDDLREKASYWDELEAASQTEYEKQQEALTAAQQRYEAAQQRIVSAELRAAGVPGRADRGPGPGPLHGRGRRDRPGPHRRAA